MHFGRGAGKAPLVRNRQEDLERVQIHSSAIINEIYSLVITITLTSSLALGYNMGT
jgi:hypothetical protein